MCPGVEFLDHMVVLCLIFWGTSIPFPNSVLGFPFLHILTISCVLFEGKHNNPKPMKCCKSTSRREVCSNTNLAQETRKKNLNLMFYLFLIFLLSTHMNSYGYLFKEWMNGWSGCWWRSHSNLWLQVWGLGMFRSEWDV